MRMFVGHTQSFNDKIHIVLRHITVLAQGIDGEGNEQGTIICTVDGNRFHVKESYARIVELVGEA